jgi:hypothetical protein
MLALLAPPDSGGQIGSNVADLVPLYGKPLSETNTAAGFQLTLFSIEAMQVEVASRDGTCKRVAYRRTDLTETDVLRLLEANRGGSDWHEWLSPGGTRPSGVRTWMRSDEAAMAVYTAGELAVATSEWTQRPTCEPEAAPASAVPDSGPNTGGTNSTALPAPGPQRLSRPTAPVSLPRPGDSRSSAVGMLGEPRGAATSGTREILLYDWGRICLELGRVVRIE